MVGGAGRFLAGVCLATGLLAAAHEARGEAPPLRSIEPEAYSDQPAGIRYGSLLYHASLRSGMAWDSNIFSTKAHVVADRIVILRPGLTVSTLDPNYKFTFRANLQQLEYDVSPSDNRLDGFADLHGTIRVQRDTDPRCRPRCRAHHRPPLLDPASRPAPECRRARRAQPILGLGRPAQKFQPAGVDDHPDRLERRLLRCPIHRRHADQPAISRPRRSQAYPGDRSAHLASPAALQPRARQHEHISQRARFHPGRLGQVRHGQRHRGRLYAPHNGQVLVSIRTRSTSGTTPSKAIRSASTAPSFSGRPPAISGSRPALRAISAA